MKCKAEILHRVSAAQTDQNSQNAFGKFSYVVKLVTTF